MDMRHAKKASGSGEKMRSLRSREMELGIKEQTREKNWAPCRFVSRSDYEAFGLGCRACRNKRMLRMWLVPPKSSSLLPASYCTLSTLST